MQLPAQLIVYDVSHSRDGGSLQLYVTDERGLEHRILLAQGTFLERQGYGRHVPGRLHFDTRVVPLRSALESALVHSLRNAQVSSVALDPKRLTAWGRPRSRDTEVPAVDGDPLLATPGHQARLRALVREVVCFVESEAYAELAAHVGLRPTPQGQRDAFAKAGTRTCAVCGQAVTVYAVKCRHCKSELQP